MTPAVIVGMAVGDALGMPFETGKDQVHKDLATWDGVSYQPGGWHKLPPGHWTDDTEMAFELATSLLENKKFIREEVAKRYLGWAQATPHGMGSTTRTAMDRLAQGLPPTESGVQLGEQDPVGSGTAMRVAPLGVFYRNHRYKLLATCILDAQITHVHVDAYAGSIAVACGVATWLREPKMPGLELIDTLTHTMTDSRVCSQLRQAVQWLRDGRSVPHILAALGNRGEVAQLVPSAVVCAAVSESFLGALQMAIRLGGDADTRAAVVGALEGARRGLEGIPTWCLDGLLRGPELQVLDARLWNEVHEGQEELVRVHSSAV